MLKKHVPKWNIPAASDQQATAWRTFSWCQPQFSMDAGSMRAAEEWRRAVAGAGVQQESGRCRQDTYTCVGVFMGI